MNSRWSQFRESEDSIPTTQYQACVFLDNAIHHLWNSSGHVDAYEAFKILNGAHNRINESEWVAA